jgi:glutaredoxin
VQLTLIGKPGCHLCDEARDAIARVRAELAERGIETALEELDILEDPQLARRHSEDIPVVQINGRRHAIWRVDPERLSAAGE